MFPVALEELRHIPECNPDNVTRRQIFNRKPSLQAGLHIFHVWVQSSCILTGDIDLVWQKAGGIGTSIGRVVIINCGCKLSQSRVSQVWAAYGEMENMRGPGVGITDPGAWFTLETKSQEIQTVSLSAVNECCPQRKQLTHCVPFFLRLVWTFSS